MIVDCGGVFYNSTLSIQSPVYPNNYPHNSNCTWTFIVAEGSVVGLRYFWVDFCRLILFGVIVVYVVVCFVCYPIVFGVMVLFCFVSYPAVFLHFHYHLPVYLRIHLFCMSPCICCCIGVLCILISVRLYVCAFIYSVCLHVYAVVSVYCVPLYLCACMSVHLSILYVSHVYAVVSVYCVSLYLCACMSVHLCIVCMSVYLCACISGYIGMSVCVFGTSISVYCVSVNRCDCVSVHVWLLCDLCTCAGLQLSIWRDILLAIMIRCPCTTETVSHLLSLVVSVDAPCLALSEVPATKWWSAL